MKPLAFFISGTGGNAMNLLNACRAGEIAALPALGLASASQAGGIARLEAEGLPVEVVLRKEFESDEAFSEACFQLAEKHGIEVICLCGWLKKLVVPQVWSMVRPRRLPPPKATTSNPAGS